MAGRRRGGARRMICEPDEPTGCECETVMMSCPPPTPEPPQARARAACATRPALYQPAFAFLAANGLLLQVRPVRIVRMHTSCSVCDAELWVDEDEYDIFADLGVIYVDVFGDKTDADDPSASLSWTCPRGNCQRVERADRKARKAAKAAAAEAAA